MSAWRGAGLFSCFSFTEGLVCVLSFLSEEAPQRGSLPVCHVDLFILAHINLGLDHSLKGERSNSYLPVEADSTGYWQPVVELASEM